MKTWCDWLGETSNDKLSALIFFDKLNYINLDIESLVENLCGSRVEKFMIKDDGFQEGFSWGIMSILQRTWNITDEDIEYFEKVPERIKKRLEKLHKKYQFVNNIPESKYIEDNWYDDIYYEDEYEDEYVGEIYTI